MSINGWIKKMWKKRKCGVFVQRNIICLQSGKCKDTDGPEDATANEISWFQRSRYWFCLHMGSAAVRLRSWQREGSMGCWRLETVHSCGAGWWGSRDFLCIAQPAVNNTVLHSCLCEGVDLLVCLPQKKQSEQKWQRETQQFLEVMNIFIVLIVVTVSGVCANVQAHQLVYFKYVECFMCLLDLNKAVESPSWITACHGKGPCITQPSYEPCHAGPC